MKTRKLVALFLSLCMIITGTSMSAFADEMELQPAEIEQLAGTVQQAETVQQEESVQQNVISIETEEISGETSADTEETAALPDEKETAGCAELFAQAEDGMIVTLKAANGAFAYNEDLSLEVTVVSEEEAQEANAELGQKTADDNIAKRVTYDVKVMHAGEEIQPLAGKKVRVEFAIAEVPSGADAVSVYHHNSRTEEIETIVDEKAIGDADEMSVFGETASFSFYTVDFTYESKTVSIAGDSTKNELAGLLAKVGITDAIADVKVYSDNTFSTLCADGVVKNGEDVIFMVYEEENIWYADSVNAFKDIYGIIVTTEKSTEYRIKVTETGMAYLSGEMYPGQLEEFFASVPDGKIKLIGDFKYICDKSSTEEYYKFRYAHLNSGTYDLFLNGYTFDMNARAFQVLDTAVLNIYGGADENDMEQEGKAISCSSQTVFDTDNGGVINLYGGWLKTDNYTVGVGAAGTFNQYGGYVDAYYQLGILNCYGGTYRCIHSWSTVNIIGGTDTGKTTHKNGNAKQAVVGGTFTHAGNNPSSFMLEGCVFQDGSPRIVTHGTNVAVRITADGVMTGHTTLADAISEDGTVTMLTDLNENITIPADKKITLNLYGKVLKGTGSGSVITVSEGAEFELMDSNPMESHAGDYEALPDGGVVTGGACAQGGGILNQGKLTVSGGTITGNAADLGGGVYADGPISVSGAAYISGNTDSVGMNENNLYLNGQTVKIAGTGLRDGALIGICMEKTPEYETPAAITGENVKDYSEYFVSDAADCDIININNVVKLRGPKKEPEQEDKAEEPETGENDYEEAPVTTGSVDAPVTGGVWNMGPGGVWTYATNGLFKATWGFIENPFAKNEENRYGWFWFDKNGSMVTGWQQINGKWYYFNTDSTNGTSGMLLINTTTPDGRKVGADGALIQ